MQVISKYVVYKKKIGNEILFSKKFTIIISMWQMVICIPYFFNNSIQPTTHRQPMWSVIETTHQKVIQS